MGAEIPDGHVLLARRLIHSSLWSMRSDDIKLAIYCIVKANWKPARWFDGEKSVTIGRGQFVTSRRSLSHDVELSEQKIRTSLKRLEKCGFLTRKSTHGWTLVTLPKYELYQDVGRYYASQQPATQPTTNPDLTSPQPRPNQPLTTIEKGEEGEEGNKKSIMSGAGAKTRPSGPHVPAPIELADLPLYSGHGRMARDFYSLVTQWKAAYPGVDLMAELRRAHAWQISNPKRKKVDQVRFLNNWLSRAQDRSPTNGTPTPERWYPSEKPSIIIKRDPKTGERREFKP